MTLVNIIKRFIVCVLFLSPLASYPQELPCRDWYYTTDKNGNKIKGRCSEAYQVNSDGQTHGKLIDYYENGKPEFIVMYSNGVRNGSFRQFKEDGVTVIVQGNFSKGAKVGKWKWIDEKGVFTTDYDTKQYAYHWKNLILKYDLNGGGVTGDILVFFEFTKGMYNDNIIAIKVNEQRVAVKDFPARIGLNENWEWGNTYIDGINIMDEINPFSISGDELNSILKRLKKKDGIPQNSYVVLQFSKGVLNEDTNYKIFDSAGRPVIN